MLALALLLAGVSIALTLCLAAQWELTASDTIALGQLIVALFLIPLAVVAFWEARNALLQAAAKPILRFAFLGEDGLLYDEYTASLPAGGGSANRVTFAVENVGDAIAVWWQVSFDLPVKMMADFRRGEGKVFVRNRQVSISMDTVGNVERYVAQSAGTVGLFPGPPTPALTSCMGSSTSCSLIDLARSKASFLSRFRCRNPWGVRAPQTRSNA
jgi:hypothetical protein